MEKIRKFASQEQYEAYYEINEHKPGNIVDVVESETHYCADLTTYCKKPSTAVRRFFAAVNGIKDYECWEEGMEESVESGYMSLKDTFWNEETGREDFGGNYAFGIEELDDGLWYMFFNVKKLESENGDSESANTEKKESIVKTSVKAQKTYPNFIFILSITDTGLDTGKIIGSSWTNESTLVNVFDLAKIEVARVRQYETICTVWQKSEEVTSSGVPIYIKAFCVTIDRHFELRVSPISRYETQKGVLVRQHRSFDSSKWNDNLLNPLEIIS